MKRSLYVSLKATWKNDGADQKQNIAPVMGKAGVYTIDLDIDSKNKLGYASPFTNNEGNDKTDQLESDAQSMGCLLFNDLQLNKEQRPSWISGYFHQAPIPTSKFKPITITLPQPYSMVNSEVTLDYLFSHPRNDYNYDGDLDKFVLSKQGLRIWTKDASSKRDSDPDCLRPKRPIKWSELQKKTKSEGRTITLYMEYAWQEGLPVNIESKKIEVFVSENTEEEQKIPSWQDIVAVRLFPVEIDILSKQKQPLTELRVGKMENAIDDGKLAIEDDVDHFYVRFKGRGLIKDAKVMLSTVDNPDPKNYNDNPTKIDLKLEGENLISASQLLVADDVDDDYAGNGVGVDDQPNDRTHKVQLKGNLKIDILYNDQEVGIKKLAVPVKKTVKVNVVIMKHKGKAAITEDEVKKDFKYCEERYACLQVLPIFKLSYGVYDNVDPDKGQLIRDDLKLIHTSHFLKNSKELLLSDIFIYYAHNTKTAGGTSRFTIDSRTLIAMINSNGNAHALGKLRTIAFPHELGHLLTIAEHIGKEYLPLLKEEIVKLNVMAVGNLIVPPGRFVSSKRFIDLQYKKMRFHRLLINQPEK